MVPNRSRLQQRFGAYSAPRAGVRKRRILALAATVIVAAAPLTNAAPAAHNSQTNFLQKQRAESQVWSPFFQPERVVGIVDTRNVIITFSDPSLGEWEQRNAERFTKKQRLNWLKKAEKRQERRLAEISSAGVQFTVHHRFLKTLNAVSVTIHGDNGQRIRNVSGVDQVTPVRTVWPAATAQAAKKTKATKPSSQKQANSSPVRKDAVRVAVIDASIDASHPLFTKAARDKDTRILELSEPVLASKKVEANDHATALAGTVLQAVERRAVVDLLSIPVLANQPARSGEVELFGRTDDLLLGLERSVDPNNDNDLGDAAHIALIASSTPFSSFTHSPEARAVAGANGLGVLVVAASGNDGASGDTVGSVGSFAASEHALSIGASDLRTKTPAVDVKVRGDGVHTDVESAPLLTAAQRVNIPSDPTSLVVTEKTGDRVSDYLNDELKSYVTDQIVLLSERSNVMVAAQVKAAADAGAKAVLIAQDDAHVAAGIIDVKGVDIPAIAVDRATARQIRSAINTGAKLNVSFAEKTVDNPAYASLASFASMGARYDGVARTDLLAPGVGMVVPGVDGAWSVASGTSIAAAWVAGEAAALKAKHQKWNAEQLRAALLASANPLGRIGARPHPVFQGSGVVSAKQAGEQAWVSELGRIDFGVVRPGDVARRKLALQALTATAAVGGTPNLSAIRIDNGGYSNAVTPLLDDNYLTIKVPEKMADGYLGGWLVLNEANLRIPWTATVRSSEADKVMISAELSNDELKPMIGPGAYSSLLTLRIGGQDRSQAAAQAGSLNLNAVQQLELRLLNAKGRDLGVIGGLDAALPGVYGFGLTSVAPSGKPLNAGKWAIKVRYKPATNPDGDWVDGPSLDFVVNE